MYSWCSANRIDLKVSHGIACTDWTKPGIYVFLGGSDLRIRVNYHLADVLDTKPSGARTGSLASANEKRNGTNCIVISSDVTQHPAKGFESDPLCVLFDIRWRKHQHRGEKTGTSDFQQTGSTKLPRKGNNTLCKLFKKKALKMKKRPNLEKEKKRSRSTSLEACE